MSLARLRSAGLVPWFAFFAWLAIATSQEPVLLRSYGVQLVEQASWAGAVVLLVLILMAESRQPMRLGWLANLGLLIGISVLQSVLPLLIDLVRERPCAARRLLDIPAFCLCWSPFALTFWGFTHRPRTKTVCLLVLAFAIGCAHSVALRSSDPFHGALSALVAVAAAAAWASNARK